MKQTVFVIVLLVLSIGIPILAESNDSLSTESENPVLQKQELKLPWYKTVKYEIGYTGGICITYGALMKESGLIMFFVPPDLIFNWINSVNVNIFMPSKSKLAIGIEYGAFPHLTEREGLNMYLYYTYDSLARVYTGEWSIYYKSILLKYYKTKSFYYGVSINHFIANTEESYHSAVNGNISDTTAYVQRECIGCGIFCGWEKLISFKGLNIYPFLKLQIGHAVEYHNNSPWEWGRKKLTIGTSGIFLGINMRFGGKR